MNIEELNSCFDSITPTKEQKDKIFAGIMSAKEQPVKIVKFNKYKCFSTLAAVLAVGVFAAVYANWDAKEMSSDIADTPENITVAAETAKPENDYSGKDEYIADSENEKKQEIIPETQKSFTQQFNEIYTDNTEASNSENTVAVMDKEKSDEIVPEPAQEQPATASLEEADAYGSTEAYDKSSRAVGGSASGGGSTHTESEIIGINQVMNHEIYGQFMPTMYSDKFNFYTATEYDNRLVSAFKNEQGNYMTISVGRAEEYSYYEQLAEVEEIKEMKPDGHMSFAVMCGDYCVIYNIDTNDALAVYDMVKSSAYFNN